MSDATAERWMPVLGYEDLYEVSDLGRVRSFDRVVTEHNGKRRNKRGRVLRPGMSRASGRRTVSLARDGLVEVRRVYILVLEAFIEPRPEGMAACHANGDPSDDRLSNLRWDTWPENARDTIAHGRNTNATKTHCPRGHGLFPPNLQASVWRNTRGRTCLACHRASSNYRSAVKRGLPADFQKLADDHHRRITQPTSLGAPRGLQ